MSFPNVLNFNLKRILKGKYKNINIIYIKNFLDKSGFHIS